MDIILYGATDIAYLVASQLHQHHNITVLYEEGEGHERFANLDVSLVIGNGGDIGLYDTMGAQKSELFIACSGIDEANIVACWTLKKIVDVETICFISKPSLYHNFSSPAHDQYHTRYDIDNIIWPEQLLTQDVFRIISVPDALDVEILAGGKAKMFEYRMEEDAVVIGKKIFECNFPKDVLISGIMRDEQLFIPSGGTTIELGDKVFFIGTGPALDSLAADFFHREGTVRTVSIIGGGSVGIMLAQLLEQRGIRVKIIEHDTKRCETLANSLTKTLVLNGDGTDLELLESESIADADVCVCITNNDEKNLLCSLLVKQLGSRRTITRVGNMQNFGLFGKMGIDVVVSPKSSALTEVLNHIHQGEVDVIALIEGGKGEVLQLVVRDTFVETSIRELVFPVNAIIGVIIRGHRVIIPDGFSTVCPGDQLMVFTMKEGASAIKELFSR